MCDIVSYPGHRNAAAHHMGKDYGLKLKEPGLFPGRAEHWAQAVHSNHRCSCIIVATIITTSVHFSVDKLGEIDDEVLVLASSKREVENALEIDRFHEHLGGCVINIACPRRKG